MIPPIIYEDENILIINKPSGLVVHPFDNSKEETLVDWLKTLYPCMFTTITDNIFTLQNGDTVALGGIVHKLDRGTSGVMVIAKTKEPFTELRVWFRVHGVEKIYVALTEGVVPHTMLRIDAPLGRNKKDYKQVAYPKNPRGELRDATTDLTVISRGNSTTFVKLTPKTGRTHQLRAHMAHIEHPIVGDIAYGSTIKCERILLHAQKISFTLFGKEYSFEAPTPALFIDNLT
ncbi:MAG: ribosomal large subunit pseudouridine synthase rRNA synthase [Candidatus Parcubacteria bacterium]